MELNETTHQGAARETLEEAGAQIKLGPLFTMFDVIRAEQVHIFFRAEMPTPTFCAGEESLDVKLFSEEEIPWDELAFKTVSKTLTLFFADRKAGRYTLHTGDVFDHTDWTDSQFKAG
jgi:ADP-ribose pyrophosphatase YjhB (NUDIX family)